MNYIYTYTININYQLYGNKISIEKIFSFHIDIYLIIYIYKLKSQQKIMDKNNLFATSKKLLNRSTRYASHLGFGNLFFFGSVGLAVVLSYFNLFILEYFLYSRNMSKVIMESDCSIEENLPKRYIKDLIDFEKLAMIE